MANPQVPQGTINRLRGSVVITDFPQLNVTAPYLGRGGIVMRFGGNITARIPTLTGAVNSPEPYQEVTITVNLLKTQGLAAQYKSQIEDNSILGNITVTPDASTLPTYQLVNCSIENVADLNFAGENPDYPVTLVGYYQINSSLFNL